MAQSGADIVSVDWTVSMDEAMRRLGPNIGVQGNLDPAVLMGPHDQVLRVGLCGLYACGSFSIVRASSPSTLTAPRPPPPPLPP